MPRNRARYRTRASFNRKKRAWLNRGKRHLPRRKVSLALKQHQFCERANGDILNIGNEAGPLAAPYYTRVFKFSDLPQCNSYSSIFEQYRMDKIVATFRYKGISDPALLAAGPAMINELNPMIYFKVDHNDVQANTLNTMKLSTKTKTHMFTNNNPEFSITLKPAAQTLVLRDVSGGIINTTNIPEWKKWIDADGSAGPGSDVEHLGLKMYAVGYQSADFKPGSIDIEYKYYFSCKSNE